MRIESSKIPGTRRAWFFAGLALAATASCQILQRVSPHEDAAPIPSTIPAAPTTSRPEAAWRTGHQLAVVDLVFEVTRVEFHSDGPRDAPKIWNHVNEMRADPEILARLGRNGLRVGVGNPSSLPAIETIARAAGASVTKEPMVPPRGMPLELTLGAFRGEQAVFSFGLDRRLTGRSFEAGERILRIDYLFQSENGGTTELVLDWEIRHDKGVLTWERSADSVRQAPDVERHVFAELTARWTLVAEEFLVVGVGGEERRDHLVGNRFLSDHRAGKRFETLLMIAPMPFQTRFGGAAPGD